MDDGLVRWRKRALTELCAISATLTLLGSLDIGAEERRDTPPNAKIHFDRGLDAARKQDFPLAIQEFSETLKAGPPDLSVVLFNLGLAHAQAGHELLGDLWFRAYLALAPAAGNVDHVRNEIDRLEAAYRAKAEMVLAAAREATGALTDKSVAGERILGADLRDTTFVDLAKAQAHAGDVAGARRTAEEIGTRSGYQSRDWALTSIARAQARAGNISAAKRTVEEMSYKAEALSAVAEALADAGDVTGAEQTLQGVSAEDSPRALEAIAEAQARRGNFVAALQTASQIRVRQQGWRNTAVEFIAEAQAKAGDVNGARRTLEQANYDGTHSHSMRPLLGIAEAQARAGDVAGAWQTAEKIHANDRSYALVLIAKIALEAGKVDAAKETLAQAWSVAGSDGVLRWWIRHLQTTIGRAGGPSKMVEQARKAIPCMSDSAYVMDTLSRACEPVVHWIDLAYKEERSQKTADPEAYIRELKRKGLSHETPGELARMAYWLFDTLRSIHRMDYRLRVPGSEWSQRFDVP